MKKIIKNIKTIFNTTSDQKIGVNCNYSNNYYGDQYCQENKEKG
jgi:hypothetical protein